MAKAETLKRYILLIIGLFFSAMGVALTKHGELGISPISSVANVMNARFGGISIGTWLIVWNCLLILGQVLVLRKKFQLIQLLQIPLSFLFGRFTDFGVWAVKNIPANPYPVRLLLVVLGTVVLGFGIALAVIANVIMNSGEAFVKAVSDTTHREFGSVKIFFDVSCVLTSLVLSLLFFHGKIVGTREGTVIAALLTGTVVKFFSRRLQKPLERILRGQ